MNQGFFDSTQGNKSSTRLIGFMVIVFAMVQSFLVLYWGRGENVILAATAAGLIFTTIAGPVMIFLFQQKRNEISNDDKPK